MLLMIFPIIILAMLRPLVSRAAFVRDYQCYYSRPFQHAFEHHGHINIRRSSIHKLNLSVSQNDDKDSENQRSYKEKQRILTKASTLSLAPMMEYTDRHFRHLVRQISSHTLVYTEMVGASAIYHEQLESKQAYQEEHPEADPASVTQNYNSHYIERYISQGLFPPLEGPSVLQLGGSDPEKMFGAAQTVMEMTDRGKCDYTAINLVGSIVRYVVMTAAFYESYGINAVIVYDSS